MQESNSNLLASLDENNTNNNDKIEQLLRQMQTDINEKNNEIYNLSQQVTLRFEKNEKKTKKQQKHVIVFVTEK